MKNKKILDQMRYKHFSYVSNLIDSKVYNISFLDNQEKIYLLKQLRESIEGLLESLYKNVQDGE